MAPPPALSCSERNRLQPSDCAMVNGSLVCRLPADTAAAASGSMLDPLCATFGDSAGDCVGLVSTALLVLLLLGWSVGGLWCIAWRRRRGRAGAAGAAYAMVSTSASRGQRPSIGGALTPDDAGPFGLSREHVVVWMLCLANLVCYVDRTNISVAIVAMKTELGWSVMQEGAVLGAFFWGYISTQVLGGFLAGRYGGRNVVFVGVVGWSLATVATPVAAKRGLGPLIWSRIVMGAFEGLTMPSIHSLIGEWALPAERSWFVALSSAGQNVGTIFAMLSAPMVAFSWPLVFYVYGFIGFVWAACFVWAVPARRSDASAQWGSTSVEMQLEEEGASLMAGEQGDADAGTGTEGASADLAARAHIVQEPQSQPLQFKEAEAEVRKLTILAFDSRFLGLCFFFFKRRAFWAIVAAHVAHNYGFYVLLMWIPQFFSDLGVELSSVGFFAVSPYVCMFVFDLLWSSYVDAHIESGARSITWWRKFSQAVAFGVPSLVMIVLIWSRASRPIVCSALLSVAMGFNMATHSAYWANLVDLSPPNAGLLCGLSNTFATLPGIYGNFVSAALLESTCSWAAVFSMAILHWALGLAVYLRFASAERIL